MSWCSDAPEDEAISLFAGLLANPDMTLSLIRTGANAVLDHEMKDMLSVVAD